MNYFVFLKEQQERKKLKKQAQVQKNMLLETIDDEMERNRKKISLYLLPLTKHPETGGGILHIKK